MENQIGGDVEWSGVQGAGGPAGFSNALLDMDEETRAMFYEVRSTLGIQ